jgi:hypothetical protein
MSHRKQLHFCLPATFLFDHSSALRRNQTNIEEPRQQESNNYHNDSKHTYHHEKIREDGEHRLSCVNVSAHLEKTQSGHQRGQPREGEAEQTEIKHRLVADSMDREPAESDDMLHEDVKSLNDKAECQQGDAGSGPGEKSPFIGHVTTLPGEKDSVVRHDVWRSRNELTIRLLILIVLAVHAHASARTIFVKEFTREPNHKVTEKSKGNLFPGVFRASWQ